MLESERIRLRLVERRDLEDIVKWRESPEAYGYFITYMPLNIDRQIKWYENQLSDPTQENFIIEHKESKLAIGMISLVDIDYKHSHAEWGRVIIGVPNMMKQGYGHEAVEMIMKYAFNHLNLRRLSCTAMANNRHTVQLYERLGFTQEGILRKYAYKDGHYLDVILFSMLDCEYHAKEGRERE